MRTGPAQSDGGTQGAGNGGPGRPGAAGSGADGVASPGELTAAARILATVMELIGSAGEGAVTVRRVAEEAGVSPSLVIYHFGSKAGLLSEVERHVARRMGEALAVPPGDSGYLLSVREAWMELAAEPGLVPYLRRTLASGGELAESLYDSLMGAALGGLDRLEGAGIVRPSADPEMRAVLLLALDLGMVLLADHAERHVGTPLLSGRGLQRWADAEMEILTEGLLDPGVSTDHEQSGHPIQENDR